MDMVLTCVDMVSNVVTPKATLAGTDRLSSQNETWRIFIPVCMAYWRNIKTLMLADLGNKSPMRQWRACKKGRRWWADNRRTPSWKPSGSETELLTLFYKSKSGQIKEMDKDEPNLEATIFASVGHRIAISRLKKFQLEPDKGLISAGRLITLTRC